MNCIFVRPILIALVEIVLNAGNDCFCPVCQQAKEFYRFIKEIKLSVYNFVQINDYTTRTAVLTGFPRSSNENYIRTALYLL